MAAIRSSLSVVGYNTLRAAMSYIDQRNEWLKKHPKATPQEIWDAGYLTATDNWCKKKR